MSSNFSRFFVETDQSRTGTRVPESSRVTLTPNQLRGHNVSPTTAKSFEVEGAVLEVLEDFGLAHIRTGEGTVYGVTRNTPGVEFAALHEGQRLRCEVTQKFHRVLHAELLE